MSSRTGRLGAVVISFAVAVGACTQPSRDSPGGGGSGGTGGHTGGGTGGSVGDSTGGRGGSGSGGTAGAGSGGASGASGGAGGSGASGAGGGESGASGTGGGNTGDASAGSSGADARGGTVDGAPGDPTCVPGTGVEPVGKSSQRDRKTCLVWELAAHAPLNNKQAAKYCDALSQDGFTDWRVPAPEELVTWPSIKSDGNAYITNPIYVPTAAASVADGCMTNSHSCNLAEYNPGTFTCAWQGVGFTGPFVCVRGTAAGGSLATDHAATSCDPCKEHITGGTPEFKPADCLPYAQ